MASPVVNAWLDAVRAWSGEGTPPAAASAGLIRPGGPAPQRPWGPDAAARLDAPGALASYLDHTLLRPDATEEEIEQLATEARTHGLGGACVHPLHVPFKHERFVPHANPLLTLLCDGTPAVHTSFVHGLLSFGTSLSSACDVVPPLPSQTTLWQSPTVCAMTAVPDAMNAVPQTPALHVRC